MRLAPPSGMKLSLPLKQPMPSSWALSVDPYVPFHPNSLTPYQSTSADQFPNSQKWGTGAVRPEQGLLKLRKEMGTFGNLRPCNFAAESLIQFSPLKESVCRGVDFNIIRELTGGIYFGDRKEDDGDGYAYDIEPYHRHEVERITRLAGHLAMQHNPPLPVWSLDKANVLATSRLWRKTVDDVMTKEFPTIKYGHQLIDSAAMLMVKNPRALNGIIVTSNLFGDIISDEASVIPGSLGLLPSASLSGIPDGTTKVNGIYEPIHGSAPDIAGKGRLFGLFDYHG
jgi:3-isopropylmalate dehydrogenase